MTDPTDPDQLDELDDLASAYLDGEVSDEERARVEGDPELLARVERMREVAGLVRGGIEPQAVTTAAVQRRRAVQAAEDAEPAGPVRPAVPIGRRTTWLPGPAVAAAVIVVLALAGLALLAAGGGDSDDSAEGGGLATAEDSGAGSEASTTTTALPSTEQANEGSQADRTDVPDLGAFASEGELRTALEQVQVTSLDAADGGEATKATVETREIARCEAGVAGQGDLGAPLAVARATLDGVPLLVFSNPVEATEGQTTTAPATQLTVVDATDCRILFGLLR